MVKKHKKIIGVILAIVGFASGVIGLWDRFFPPVPDNEVFIMSIEMPDVVVSKATPMLDTSYLKANNLIIDGVVLNVSDGGLLLANRISMKNGGQIFGSNYYVVSTIIDNGHINSSKSKGFDGGNIFIVSAQINGTQITSNGKNGVNGVDGANGINGRAGSNGRNGSCNGFGAWRSAHAGGNGINGTNGIAGKVGQNGGNAGNIMVLTSYTLTTTPEAIGGLEGKGGKGGAAGLGGKGGTGGRGCTGLGGAQNSQPSGPDGVDGKPGKDGQDGIKGVDKTPTIKLIAYSSVKDAYKSSNGNKKEFITNLRSIRPRK